MTQNSAGISRRRLMGGTVAAGGAIALGAGITGLATADAEEATLDSGPSFGPITVTPARPQYPDLISGMNQRFIGKPEAVQLVDAVGQVPAIVQRAVAEGKRITVRSGGHCFEDFVYNPNVQVVLDLSNLNGVYFDPVRNAIAVEAGATLLDVYEVLYEAWGVTVPGGICYSVGAGGHVSGGGWGMLCRQHGLISDHLYAVEVVVVDVTGTARVVVATREPTDPNRDLWWAHTGGGGGNFGVVTRYFFRSPNATGTSPTGLLPRPPSYVYISAGSFAWSDMTAARFNALLSNFGAFHAANSAPNNPYAGLCSFLVLNHQSNGQIGLVTQVDALAPNALDLLNSYLDTVTRGVGAALGPMTNRMGDLGALPQFAAPRRLPWLQATRMLGTTNPSLNDPTLRAEYKSAYMRANFPSSQITALYKHLTRTDIQNPLASVTLSSFGGKVNALAPDATAFPHRAAAFKLLWMVLWNDPALDAKYLAWARESYQEVYAATGGVPVPNAVTDGCYLNYADIDLSNPAFNRSGVPWFTLYYKDNYPRLQQVKARYDPRNVFQHGQSVQLP